MQLADQGVKREAELRMRGNFIFESHDVWRSVAFDVVGHCHALVMNTTGCSSGLIPTTLDLVAYGTCGVGEIAALMYCKWFLRLPAG